MVELVSPLTVRDDESHCFEYREMLRDRLSRERQPTTHGQAGTELEQRLSVAIMQLVENCSPCRCRKRLEQVGHVGIIGKSWLACQSHRGVPPSPGTLTDALARGAHSYRQVNDAASSVLPVLSYLAVIGYAHSGCVRTTCVPRSLRATMRDGASPFSTQ